MQDNLEEKIVDKIFARWSLEDIRYYQQWLSLQENIDLISFSMLTNEYIEWDFDIPTLQHLKIEIAAQSVKIIHCLNEDEDVIEEGHRSLFLQANL